MNDHELKELEKALERIWDIALKFGLDPFPTRFEVVPATVMYEIGSYALPGRYSHWTFGKAYHRMKTMYDYGLSKIYEVVINTNPSYGFLMETNSPLQNKLVIAHVLGHTDFFKHNVYFSRTNRRMIDAVSSHASRMTEYEFRYGRKTVERILDAVLSIEEHIDPHVFMRRAPAGSSAERAPQREGRYDDLLAADERPAAAVVDDDAGADRKRVDDGESLPAKDLLRYIARHSPALAEWQRDIVSMIREEMEYFVPQMQTKTLNEGWACATKESLLATENGFLYFDELYEEGRGVRVASGERGERHRVTDFHKEERVQTIRIRTRRGLTIEGSPRHRVMSADGTWVQLESVGVGDRVALRMGTDVSTLR